MTERPGYPGPRGKEAAWPAGRSAAELAAELLHGSAPKPKPKPKVILYLKPDFLAHPGSCEAAWRAAGVTHILAPAFQSRLWQDPEIHPDFERPFLARIREAAGVLPVYFSLTATFDPGTGVQQRTGRALDDLSGWAAWERNLRIAASLMAEVGAVGAGLDGELYGFRFPDQTPAWTVAGRAKSREEASRTAELIHFAPKRGADPSETQFLLQERAWEYQHDEEERAIGELQPVRGPFDPPPVPKQKLQAAELRGENTGRILREGLGPLATVLTHYFHDYGRGKPLYRRFFNGMLGDGAKGGPALFMDETGFWSGVDARKNKDRWAAMRTYYGCPTMPAWQVPDPGGTSATRIRSASSLLRKGVQGCGGLMLYANVDPFLSDPNGIGAALAATLKEVTAP